ncbi:hypothetical protein AB0H83_11165 [Dactylosporangium sp. NPDC050688]|uniref:hypothetical protein n=1 Tax=Dactylosporangium sp. NPDC050688 TaxID=3157217 RepID=UPI0033F5D567
MTEASNWRDVKARARAADPIWDGAERVARRQQMREQMLALVNRAERLRDLQAANNRRLAERDVHAGDLSGLIGEVYKAARE